MIIKSFFVEGLAHLSYLVCSGSACMVIDPERNTERYIDAAAELNGRITHILETHLHADFISGHMDLAMQTGARIYAPRAAQCAYDHVPVVEGDTIMIGEIIIRVRETPGHTPAHVSYVMLDSTRDQDDPAAVFTGDTLFVGDVGRPDLFPDRGDELVQQLYRSLHHQLLSLPDYVDLYPAHGAGSLCGRAMALRQSSTIGYERKHNRELAHDTPEALAASLLSDMPPAPGYFARCSEMNRRGPALTSTLAQMAPLGASDARTALGDGAIAIDVRPFESYCGAHIPNSLSIDLRGNAHLFAGWLVPPDRPILLVADSEEQARQAKWTLLRVGLDHTRGWIKGGITGWAASGYDIRHTRLISASELSERVAGTTPLNLVDVRSAIEFEGAAIAGARNIPVPELDTRQREMDPSIPAITICRTGSRAAMAASLLERSGWNDIAAVAGGMAGYAAAGYSQECTICTVPHGPRGQA